MMESLIIDYSIYTICAMGAVFRPKDLRAGWRKTARESIKDLSPDTKDSVLKIIDSWEDTKSEQKRQRQRQRKTKLH
jgi:hypothetical protein